MSFVIDASVMVAWAFEEIDARATAARERIRYDPGFVPTLWRFELRNALMQGERRGRLTPADTTGFLRDVAATAIVLDRTPDEVSVLRPARHHRLTVYDAAYLELALSDGLPLATLDGPLAAAAQAEQVTLIGPAAN